MMLARSLSRASVSLAHSGTQMCFSTNSTFVKERAKWRSETKKVFADYKKDIQAKEAEKREKLEAAKAELEKKHAEKALLRAQQAQKNLEAHNKRVAEQKQRVIDNRREGQLKLAARKDKIANKDKEFKQLLAGESENWIFSELQQSKIQEQLREMPEEDTRKSRQGDVFDKALGDEKLQKNDDIDYTDTLPDSPAVPDYALELEQFGITKETFREQYFKLREEYPEMLGHTSEEDLFAPMTMEDEPGDSDEDKESKRKQREEAEKLQEARKGILKFLGYEDHPDGKTIVPVKDPPPECPPEDRNEYGVSNHLIDMVTDANTPGGDLLDLVDQEAFFAQADVSPAATAEERKKQIFQAIMEMELEDDPDFDPDDVPEDFSRAFDENRLKSEEQITHEFFGGKYQPPPPRPPPTEDDEEPLEGEGVSTSGEGMDAAPPPPPA